MTPNFFQRDQLDKELSSWFNHWDIIADNKGEIIWTFDNVAYHGWRPGIAIFWNYIFADFSQAISKQWRDHREVFDKWCWDDDVYIDRRKHDLSFHYRVATEKEKELFETLITQRKEENK